MFSSIGETPIALLIIPSGVALMSIEYFDKSEQGAASATYVFGYRIGMLIAGAGALLMADHLGWTAVYQIIGLSFLIVMLIFFKVKEPEYTPTEKISFKNAVVEPLADFFKKPGWLLILLFLLTYKLCETTLGTVTPKLYLELGFTKTQIAAVVKVWGIVATLLGGFLGGALIVRVGIIKSLIICSSSSEFWIFCCRTIPSFVGACF